MLSHWLLRSFSHYDASDFHSRQWGTAREQTTYQKFSCEKRKKDWLLGRLTAKELIQKYYLSLCGTRLSFPEIEILNAPSGKPYFQPLASMPDCPALSISHSQGLAFCSLQELTPREGFGIDIEYASPRPSLFVDTFYNAQEQKHLAAYQGKEHTQAVTAIWSLKESVLKALGHGLRMDTNKITVQLSPPPWNQWNHQHIQIPSMPGIQVQSWMRYIGYFVLSMVKISDLA